MDIVNYYITEKYKLLNYCYNSVIYISTFKFFLFHL